MHRSYVPKAWIDAFIANEQESLPKDSATRFFSILRVKPDEEVAVFDGEGRAVVGFVEKHALGHANFVQARLYIKTRVLPELIVIQAAIDEAKLSQTIARGCEFGVDRFIIFSAQRSDSFCFDKLKKRHERFARIALDAARQSGRYFIPAIDFVKSLDDVLATASPFSVAIFGEVLSAELLSKHLQRLTASELPCYIAIGPEGGFNETEMQKLKATGFFGVTWAPHVLRAELALLAPLTMLNAFLGRA
jgi:16S rRNA (uracil1498-N3)-methyltransferase